jgi:hypothetical protein
VVFSTDTPKNIRTEKYGGTEKASGCSLPEILRRPLYHLQECPLSLYLTFTGGLNTKTETPLQDGYVPFRRLATAKTFFYQRK